MKEEKETVGEVREETTRKPEHRVANDVVEQNSCIKWGMEMKNEGAW